MITDCGLLLLLDDLEEGFVVGSSCFLITRELKDDELLLLDDDLLNLSSSLLL